MTFDPQTHFAIRESNCQKYCKFNLLHFIYSLRRQAQIHLWANWFCELLSLIGALVFAGFNKWKSFLPFRNAIMVTNYFNYNFLSLIPCQTRVISAVVDLPRSAAEAS